MKRIRSFIALLLVCIVLGAFAGEARAQSPIFRAAKEQSQGLVRKGKKYYYYENGVMVTNAWRTITVKGKQYRYYFTANGSAKVGHFYYEGNYYAFNKKGRLLQSNKTKVYKVGKEYFSPYADGTLRRDQYIILKNNLYYAGPDGRLLVNGSFNGVTFRKGKAVNGVSKDSKIVCLKTLDQVTTEGASPMQKLAQCWDFLTDRSSFTYVVRYDADRDDPEWMERKAMEMLKSHGGDCVSFACAFAGLASAIGYEPEVIYGRVPGTVDQAADGFTTHCWVLIDGKFFDPEGEFEQWNMGCFNLSAYPFDYQVHNIYDYDTGSIVG